MQVTALSQGLWRWTAAHPDWAPGKDWPQLVGSIYLETAEAVVLIDPQAPVSGTDEGARFWRALDRDVERVGRPVVILIGNRYHARSADSVRQRYSAGRGCQVLVPESARGLVACAPTGTFRHGERLVGGIEALGVEGLDGTETIFRLPAGEGLVFADSVLGVGAGRVSLPPPGWAEPDPESQRRYREDFRPFLRSLLERPVGRLLVSHGDPVLEGGEAALRAAIDAPP